MYSVYTIHEHMLKLSATTYILCVHKACTLQQSIVSIYSYTTDTKANFGTFYLHTCVHDRRVVKLLEYVHVVVFRLSHIPVIFPSGFGLSLANIAS